MSYAQADLLSWAPSPTPPRAERQHRGLLSHPLWPSLRRYLLVQATERHTRLELRGVPMALAVLALGIECPCVACGAPVSPVRSRRAPGNLRGDNGKPVSLYLAVTCGLRQRMGCARGRQASAEYERIKAEVRR